MELLASSLLHETLFSEPVSLAVPLDWPKLVVLEQVRHQHFVGLLLLLHFCLTPEPTSAATMHSTAAAVLFIDVDLADSGSTDEIIC